jgi:hypothetical protein
MFFVNLNVLRDSVVKEKIEEGKGRLAIAAAKKKQNQ